MVDTNVTFDELMSACAAPSRPTKKEKPVRVTYNNKPANASAAQVSYASAKKLLSPKSRNQFSKSVTGINLKSALSRREREDKREKVSVRFQAGYPVSHPIIAFPPRRTNCWNTLGTPVSTFGRMRVSDRSKVARRFLTMQKGITWLERTDVSLTLTRT